MSEKPVIEWTNGDNLPVSLIRNNRFCCWNYEYNESRGAWTKVPYDPVAGRRAKSTDPETFVSFGDADFFAGIYDGVGVGLFGNLAGIDIDHCVNADGSLTEMARDIVETMNAYTEYSPSGTGVRILFTVSDGFDYDTEKTYYIKNSAIGLEIYVAGKTNRFLTLTGNAINECELSDKAAELQTVLDRYMKRPEKTAADTVERDPVDMSDADLIEKALNSNDSKFKTLWAGDISGYASHSEADQALCNKLAFWTGADAGRIDSIFRQSGLMRGKWNRDDYRKRTIQNAIDQCSETYKQGVDTVEQFDERHPEALKEFKDRPQPDEKQTETRPDDENPPQFRAYDVAEYMSGDAFGNDIEYFKQYKDRKTGFDNIDQYLTLYPGLCFLGGAASLGKSTFMVNLCDNLAQRGETVLYFALEQEPIELTTKILARHLDAIEPGTPLTNVKIKNGETNSALELLKQQYAETIKDRFFIVRCDFTTTAAAIQEYVEKFIKATGRRPIVVVDYLQLIAPPDDFKGDTRAATDLAIKTFKALQLKNELLFIVVSSFNRSGYDSPVTYSDFKESGSIEYTADFLWGLQLEIVSHRDFYLTPGAGGRERLTTAQEKDAMIDAAINTGDGPKKVQFVSLKSRNGRQRYICNFNYYMQYDSFIDPGTKPQADDDGFLDAGQMSVFDDVDFN